VPGDHGVEPAVQVYVRPDGVVTDSVAELAQPGKGTLPFARREVVEDAAGHQEVRRGGARLRLELRELDRGLEREVDVVAQEQLARPRLLLEEGEPVAARPSCLEQIAVVVEVEGAGRHRTFEISTRLPSGSRT
jgi:hypothetical protein